MSGAKSMAPANVQRRDQRRDLLDVNDVALGYLARMRFTRSRLRVRPPRK